MSTAVPSYDSSAPPKALADARGLSTAVPLARLEAPLPAPPNGNPQRPSSQPYKAFTAASPSQTVNSPAPTQPAAGLLPEWTPGWAPWLMKWRWTLVPLWLVMHLLAFNGQWRIGADSATFRSVAHSLAVGEGYAILGEPQRQVYPGLPLILAALEKGFGPVAWPGILVMLAIAAATLYFTYRLIRRVSPAWVATVVTAGVAFNAVFFQHGHELMTDLPFLLGVVMALWGWETLTDPGLLRRLRSGVWLALGLALAASMRPTFWVLALAFVLVSLGGLFVGLFPRYSPRAWTSGPNRARSWRFYAACLSVVIVVGLVFAALDPRTRSLDLLDGGYEAELAQRIVSLDDRLRETPDKLWDMLEDHLETLFFAERVEGLNLVLVGTLLFGVTLVARRRALWGLLVAILLLTLYFASTAGRYYLMVLPILWLAWISVVSALAGRCFSNPRTRTTFAAVLIGLVWACNLGHDVKLIVEQRATPFLENYKDGLYEPVVAVAEVIRRHTHPHERIIGPFAPEMTYLSGRRVLGRRELFSGEEGTTRIKAGVVRDSGADWAVFPTTVYEKKDLPFYRLGRQGIFVPNNRDDSNAYSAGEFDGTKWYLTRWAIDDTMIPADGPPGRHE